jgi:hypothetical protein
MDCRSFRNHHVAYLDDTLPGELLIAAERHVRECAACAARDTAVRRGLLLARNLPPIEPSDDFATRLAARLDDVRCGRCQVPDDDVPLDWSPSRAELLRTALSGTAVRRAALIAAGLLVLTYAGDHASNWRGGEGADNRDVELPPVVATLPEPLPTLQPLPGIAPPALLTSASTGIPVWPAALLADQAPARFAEASLSW